MKKSVIVLIMTFALMLTTGCSKNTSNQVAEDNKKPVKILTVKEEMHPVVLEYTGVVGSEELKKLAFKSGGKIKKVFIKTGDKFEAGQPLIQLDTTDLEYALSAAKGQMDATKSQFDKALNGASPEEFQQILASVKKAENTYNFAKDNYEKFQKLFNEGAISKQDLEKAKLELDIRESDLNIAKETEKQAEKGAREEDKASAKGQWEQAKSDYEYKMTLLEDATLKSDSSGYVVDILYEEGEMVAYGYPILVVRNDKQVVDVGISSKDLAKISIGTKGKIEFEGRVLEGEVTNIGQTPDNQTLTYPIEITLKEKTLPLGTVVKVILKIGEESGIWIPINGIMVNGEDYVYVVRDGKAYKNKVILGEVNGNYVKVKGITNGDDLVIEGMHRLKDQDPISIQE